MIARRAFTLLELLVAIVVTGLVALLVYGAAGAAADVQQKLSEKHDTRQSQTAMRETITAALRNARPALSNRDTAFLFENRRDAAGRPAGIVSFVAAGELPPLTPDADWSLTLAATPKGLVLSASAVGFASPARMLAELPGITGMQVRALPTSQQVWVDRWSDIATLPRAVELTFFADTGAVGAPLYVVVPAGAGGPR